MSKSRLSRLDADLDRVESMSSRLLPHTLLALALCGLFWLLPDSLEHYALALAVFALAAQSALSLSSPEAGGGLRSEYLHYLASLLGPAGLASVGVLGFLMIFLPTASLPSLAGLAYLAAAVFALLALIRADRPREETVHPPLDPATIVALLLSAGFVSAYAWRFVLVPMQASYASGVSLLAGLAFLILWVGIFALKSAASRRQASVPGYARRVRSGTLRHLWHAGLSLAGGTVFILLVARESLWPTVSVPPSAPMDTSAPVVSSGTLDPESERVVSELISRYRDEAPVSSGATSSGAVAPDAETSSGIIAAPADSEPTMQTMRDAYPYARYIGLGDVGRDVEWIQRLLVRTGYRSGPVTSVFDQVTSDEFSRYMRDRTGDSRGTYGQLGPQTMARFLSLPLE